MEINETWLCAQYVCGQYHFPLTKSKLLLIMLIYLRGRLNSIKAH